MQNIPTLVWLVLAQLAAVLIWGATISARVRSLERDVEPLKALSVICAELKIQMNTVERELRELNKSIGWMRRPAPFTARPPED